MADPASGGGTTSERRTGRTLQGIVLVVPVAVFAVQAWSHRWMTDDGFINLRVVRQIEAGHGPVFNAGERVEAFTSPLWVAVLTIGDVLLPLPLEWVAVVLGIAGSVAGLALAVAGSARLWQGPRSGGLLVPAGALVPIALYPMWFFASSGLEGGLVFAWEGACLFLLSRLAIDDRVPSSGTAAVLGLGWLIRPELALMTLAFLVAVVVVARPTASRSPLVRFVAAALALPAAYQLFRMGYYASVVPNTALAKGAGRAQWARGGRYVGDLVDTYALWFPALVLALAAYVPLVRHGMRNRRTAAAAISGAFVAGSALTALYIARVGGDYIHARLLLPAVFGLCAPVAVVRLRRRTVAAVLVMPWAVLSATSFVPDVPFVTSLDGRRNLVTAEQVLGFPTPAFPWFTGDGVYWEDRRLGPVRGSGLRRPTVALLAIGVPGFVLGPDVDVFDTLGLADPFTARFTPTVTGVPGHEKQIPAPWAAARLTAPGTANPPERFAPGGLGFVVPMIPPTTGRRFEAQVAQVRRVLTCGDVRELRDALTRRLTARRFVDNIAFSVRSLSLEIPPDPDVARRELCGDPSGRDG